MGASYGRSAGVSVRFAVVGAVLAALSLAPVAGAWSWPTGGAVLQPFVFDPSHPYGGGQHRGIDVGGDAGATVAAPAAGTVTFAGSVPSSGKSVTIATADGYDVTLTHLGSITVVKDAAVAEGDSVGTVGPSGDPEVSVPYVHLGVRLDAQAQGYVDPQSLLPAAYRGASARNRERSSACSRSCGKHPAGDRRRAGCHAAGRRCDSSSRLRRLRILLQARP